MGIDTERIEGAIRELLIGIGENPEREGLVDTPQRVARMYSEIVSGFDLDPNEIMQTQFNEGHQEMVVVRDVPFYSLCEHHLLPFFGKASVAYIPQGHVVGISKLARTIDVFAKRPQLQERMTSQVADSIMSGVKPQGVAVILRAEHLCMAMRGIRKPGSSIITSAMRGVFESSARTRSEVLALLREEQG